MLSEHNENFWTSFDREYWKLAGINAIIALIVLFLMYLTITVLDPPTNPAVIYPDEPAIFHL